MTREKARELLSVQADMGGGYNRNGARLLLIREFDFENLFGFKPGTVFKKPDLTWKWGQSTVFPYIPADGNIRKNCALTPN